MIVKYSDYYIDKKSFFKKHKNDFQCETRGSSAEYYTKTYEFADGAVWYEVMTKETVEEIVEIYLCNVKVKIDMMKTEYWSSDDSNSKVYYDKWDHTK